MKYLTLFLLINSLSLVLTKTVDYDTDKKYVESTGTSTEQIRLLFKREAEVPEFVKIIVTPDQGYDTPSLCFSETDNSCDKDRIVMAKRADKKPVIACASKSEMIGNKELKTKVTCQEKCSYKIRFEGDSACKFDINKGIVYSYVASEKNKNMKFELWGQSNVDSFMNIGLEGSENANINIENEKNDTKRVDYGAAKFRYYQIGEYNNETVKLASFSVTNAIPGEYIRITAYITNDNTGPDNLLYPGGPAVMGAVTLGMLTFPEICLPMSSLANEFKDIGKFYLTGKVYSQYALFWPGDENKEYVDDIEIEVSDGLLGFQIESKGKLRYACFEFSYMHEIKNKDVLFSVQIIPMATKNTPDFYFSTPPMQIGQTYRQMLSKGKVAIYHGAKIDESKGRVSFNLFNSIGIAYMWVGDCEDFPNCKFNVSEESPDIPSGLEYTSAIGRNALYERKIAETMEVLGPKKKVIVVKCMDDGNDENGYCQFDTSIFTNGDKIKLIEGQKLAKYLKGGDTGTFIANFNGAVRLLSAAVEIMVHSGEVTFDGRWPDYLEGYKQADKYILANKVFLDFRINRDEIKELEVNYKAIKNSFITVKYRYHIAEATIDYDDEFIFPDESYLVQMDPIPDTTLNLHIENDRSKKGEVFLTNFFALNCDFKITTKRTNGEKEIVLTDGYAQDYLGKNDGEAYTADYYTYKLIVDKVEQSNYNKKKCMVYVSGSTTVDLVTTPRILISNNVNQQMIFDESFRNLKFLYPVPDTSIDLVIYANIINKALFYVQIAIDNEKEMIRQEVISFSTPYYLKSEEYKPKCKDDTFCNILVVVYYAMPFDDIPPTNPMVEVTIREATKMKMKLRVPSYLQKGQAKKDFTSGDGYYYLYTDLGKNDQGDITINFFRDFGEVYGRIVRREEKDADNEIEWMDRYRLPSHEWVGDDKNYDKYLKKYHISIEDTEDCISGCYLILGIIISQIGEYAHEWKFYPFSIITDISPSAFGETPNIPVITIQVDEFIIGNVPISKNVRISQFYQVWLPRDTFQLQFDWQSDLAGLYINIGEDKPTARNADFKLLPNGIDSVLYIDRPDIVKVMKEKKLPYPAGGDSFEDLRFTIGIWTDKTDTADTELYSLRVHEGNFDNEYNIDFDILEVNTDQKVLCKTIYTGQKYRCLFVITYDDQDVEQKMDLLVYSRSLFRGDKTEVYASFIDKTLYDEYSLKELKDEIPSYETAQYNSIKDDTVYFHIKLNDEHKGKYLYVNVRSDFYDDIMMVASMISYDTDKNPTQFYPNARTENLIQVKEEKLALEFWKKESLIVNIENLDGEADIYWEEDPGNVYYMRGKGDRLTLTTSKSLGHLIFKNLNYKEGSNEPGFVFILDFYTRDNSKNFDEVPYGNSLEISYRNTDLPIYLYSKEVDYSNDINLAVTFRDSKFDTEGEYDVPPIIVRAYLDKRDVIYAAKRNPEFEPTDENKMDGIYDVAIKTAWVFLSDIIMNEHFIIDPKDYPTILFYVGKNPDYKKEKKYETFNVETQFTRANNLIVPVEKVYNYAKFNGLLTHYYRLKNDKKKDIMIVTLSFNGDALSWCIGDQGAHENSTSYNIEAHNSRGKIIITFKPPETEDYVYLNVYKTDYTADVILAAQNYVYKYINLKSASEFVEFKIVKDDGSIKYQEEKQSNGMVKLTCSFNKIDVDKDKANITYFLKIADSRYYIKGENFVTIAATESPYYAKYKRNPEANGDVITLSATGNFENWCYIQIIAQIQQNKVLEYVAYDGVYIERKPDDNKDKDDKDKDTGSNNTGLLVGISVSLAVLIIGLAVVVFYFQQKNKSLLNQVKHVSFQQNTATSDPDLLLSKPQEQKA